MNIDLMEKYKNRPLGVIDEHGQCFESLEALAAWENAITERLKQASRDIAAGRTYSLPEARLIVSGNLKI